MIREIFSFFKKKATINFTDQDGNRHSYPIDPRSTVLDTLLDAGHTIPHSCKSGSCQSCTMQCSNPSALPNYATQNLKAAEKELGYFQACSCQPNQSIDIALLETTGETHTVKVLEKTLISNDVIHLTLEAPFTFRGGQFVNLFKDSDTCRSYSIASQDNSNTLEFHIKHLPDGTFSHWAASELDAGDSINIQGPFGDCFYTEAYASRPLLLCGIGTGLAPLLGVIKTALKQNHQAPIHLVLGARASENFYLRDELASLVKKHTSLSIDWVAQDMDSSSNDFAQTGDLYEHLKNTFPDLNEFVVYLCGAPSFIQKAKKQSYLSGAAMNHILSDAFQPAS